MTLNWNKIYDVRIAPVALSLNWGICPQIKLSTKSFSLEAAKLLGLGINNIRSSLVDADLSDIIAGALLPLNSYR